MRPRGRRGCREERWYRILLLYTVVPTLSSSRYGAVKSGRPHAGPSEQSHGREKSCKAQSMRKVWVCGDEQSEKRIEEGRRLSGDWLPQAVAARLGLSGRQIRKRYALPACYFRDLGGRRLRTLVRLPILKVSSGGSCRLTRSGRRASQCTSWSRLRRVGERSDVRERGVWETNAAIDGR